MATLANINPRATVPAGAPTTNPMAAAADEFVAQPGAVYMVRFTNGSATPANIVVDDPTSPDPGNATAFNPDITQAMPAAPATRTLFLSSARFRNSQGKIAWTYSASMVNAASLVEIYGPL